MKKFERELKNTHIPKRWVYGTRSRRWHLIDKTDRDFEQGITQREFRSIGVDRAKEKYLSAVSI